jgi:formiminoglutamase
MDEPAEPGPGNWPPQYDLERAATMRAALTRVLTACLDFATEKP